MANEAVIIELGSDTLNTRTCTVGSLTAITKGSLWRLIDPNTASGAVTVANQACAGIAAADKSASDGATRHPFHKKGIFDCIASGSITVGNPIAMAPDNYVIAASTVASGAQIIGSAEETATAGEVIRISLNIR